MRIQLFVMIIVALSLTCNCQSQRVLHSCPNGTFWNAQTCIPCQTVVGGFCTCSTVNTCDTLTCAPGGYKTLNAQNTTICRQGCDSQCGTCGVYQNAEICFNCTSNTPSQMIGSVCVQLDDPALNCNQFDPLTAQCQKCSNGFYATNNNDVSGMNPFQILENACLPCSIQNCGSCDSANTCLMCNTGYAINATTTAQPTCASCSSSCLNCNGDITKCITCNAASYLNNNKLCTQCSTINNQCTSCSDNSTCLSCLPTYYLNTTKICSSCSNNCLQCSNANTCTQCQPLYQLANNQCLTCPINCQSCTFDSSNNPSCKICFNQYLLNNGTCVACTTLDPNALYCAGPNDSPSSTPQQVTQCQNTTKIFGYFLGIKADNTVSCVNPSSKCLEVAAVPQNGTITCKSCYPNMYLVNGQCVLQPIACLGTIAVNNSQLTCSICYPGYYIDSNSVCSKCAPNCSTCTNNVCSVCSAGYLLSNGNCSQCQVAGCGTCVDNSQQCQTCLNGFFLALVSQNQQTCSACPGDCATCAFPGNVCATCRAGSIVQNGGCVSISMLNCIQTDSTGKCSVCQYNFYLNKGQCLICFSPSSGFVCRGNYKNATRADKSGLRISSIIMILALTYLL